MARPAVDVIVPFRGGPAEREALRERLGALRLGAEDTVLVVDNTPGADAAAPPGCVPVLAAAGLATPGYARNRGAAAGSAPWLLFLDADTVPPADLLDRYFDRAPSPDSGLLAGGLIDEPVERAGAPAARFAYLEEKMSQRQTFRLGEWAFSQTANAACRRAAFEAIGGFREEIRAGEDADLCYRLRAAGWQIERREEAAVIHRNRRTTREFVAQKLVHGAAAAWLQHEYPGSFPPRRRPGLLLWALRFTTAGLVSAVRAHDRDTALRAVFEPLEQLAYEFGRVLPNHRRPARRAARRR